MGYTRLVIYGKNQKIAQEFFDATGPGKTAPQDIVKFISAVRKELGVDEKDFVGPFQYRLLRAGGETQQTDDQKGEELEPK